MSMTNGSRGRTRTDRITVPRGGASVLSTRGGRFTLRSIDGGVRVEPDAGVGCALLRVGAPVELLDGDLIRAGRSWLSFRAGRQGRPGTLGLLDARGNVRLGLGLRGRALSVGREVGDVVMPWDPALAELHLQLLMRPDATFVQDLASATGTWIAVRAGEVLASGSAIAAGERLVVVSTPPARAARADGEDPTRMFAAVA